DTAFGSGRTITLPITTGTVALTSQIPTISDAVYGGSWNGNTGAASKNSIYDKIQSLAAVATSNSYTDLDDKPTIPTNNSALTNGAGYMQNIADDTTPQLGG